jgi:uncharacterized protein (DUF849 family)
MNAKVGLEDSVYLTKGELASSNAALVKKVARIVEDLGGEIATAGEARRILQLPESNAYVAPSLPQRRDASAAG